MCYICEANGTVGKRYKEAQREVARALKAWAPALRRGPYDERYEPGPKPHDGDWTKEPKRQRPWTARDFVAYQVRTRYHLLTPTRSDERGAIEVSLADLAKIRRRR